MWSTEHYMYYYVLFTNFFKICLEHLKNQAKLDKNRKRSYLCLRNFKSLVTNGLYLEGRLGARLCFNPIWDFSMVLSLKSSGNFRSNWYTKIMSSSVLRVVNQVRTNTLQISKILRRKLSEICGFVFYVFYNHSSFQI